MRRLSGASNGGSGGGKAAGGGSGAAAGPWEGGGNAARIRGVNVGIMDEKVLELVFRTLNWDPQSLCVVARVSRRLRAVAERVLWRELCVSRAPRMVAALTGGAPASAPAAGRIGGGWPALGKLLLFCCGAAGTAVPGHFAPVSRFSKTSGRSFLSRRCSVPMTAASSTSSASAATSTAGAGSRASLTARAAGATAPTPTTGGHGCQMGSPGIFGAGACLGGVGEGAREVVLLWVRRISKWWLEE